MEKTYDITGENLIDNFLESCITHLKENPLRLRKCLDQISEAQLWQKPNSQTNSIGNLMLHLCGNITQYIFSGLAEAPDNRQRDAEFAASGGAAKAELLKQLTEVTDQAIAVIRSLDAEALIRDRVVQGFRLSGFAIVIHVVEHYSYHVGQIAFWTKFLCDKDLGFYAGMDLNVRAE